MGVKVRIPTPLRNLTGGEAEVHVSGSTIGEVIESLEAAYPGIRDRLCDANGDVRRFINLFLNEEDIRFLEGPATPVSEGDVISIIPAIAGGYS